MEKADRFIEALHRAETEHAAEPLLELFSGDAELLRLNSDHPYRGPEGARDFWHEYLSFFQEIHSHFTHVIEAGNDVVLEWEAAGRFASGAPVRYRGVSVMEFAGEKVRAFRTYYDSAAFTQPAHA